MTIRSTRRAGRSGAALLAVAVGLATASCARSGPDPLTINVKRVALDLVFEADKDAAKPPPKVIVQQLPPPESYAITLDEPDAFVSERPKVPATFVKENACPTADPGATPDELAGVRVVGMPTSGRYTFKRQGTFAIEGGLFPLKGKLFPYATRDYRKVAQVQPPADALGTVPAPYTQFEVVDPGLNEAYTVRTFQVKEGEVDLVKRLDHTSDGDVVFTPTPPAKFMNLGVGEGDSWTSASIDPATGTAVTLQGKITKRENVDLCGKVFDAFRVEMTERYVNLVTNYSSVSTDTTNDPVNGGEGKPNVYWIATQRGSLILQEDQHTKTVLTVGGVPVTVNLDYHQTLTKIDPDPLPANAQ